MSDKKPWAGRFNEPTDAFVEAFTASVEFDQRLAPQDIAGSIAHATMLAKQGILTDAERDAILSGLETIRARIAAGDFPWSVQLEDVHMNIEAELTAQIGIAGKKLHTGRSRNDQVATDIRLWLRDAIDAVIDEIRRLQRALLTLAGQEADTILPGFTHLQTAQPVTFGHHMLAYVEMLGRDRGRLGHAATPALQACSKEGGRSQAQSRIPHHPARPAHDSTRHRVWGRWPTQVRDRGWDARRRRQRRCSGPSRAPSAGHLRLKVH